MKRSRKITLILMSSLLYSCIERQEVSIYKNIEDCTKDGFTFEQCQKFQKDAIENSPKFNKKEECEEEYGKEICSKGKDNNGDFWIPALAGFIVGNFHKKQDQDQKTVPFISNGLYNNPLSDDYYKSGNGADVRKSSTGRVTLSKSTVTFRGGFSGGGRVFGS